VKEMLQYDTSLHTMGIQVTVQLTSSKTTTLNNLDIDACEPHEFSSEQYFSKSATGQPGDAALCLVFPTNLQECNAASYPQTSTS
jgi:hypothetical protein